LLHLVGFGFIEFPTLKMHGQTQIKFTEVLFTAESGVQTLSHN
jgi:hypothetical protein